MVEIFDIKKIESFFFDWEETMIWSFLQGCMGSAWADGIPPASARIDIGDFTFLAGQPCRRLTEGLEGRLTVPRTEDWGQLLEEMFGDRLERFDRYAIKKEPDVFDVKQLRGYVEALPPGFRLLPIDRTLYQQILSLPWCRDLCSNFSTWPLYQSYGLGFAAVDEAGKIVGGASSYTYYREGIEIEIDTRQDCRRRGIALACGARLILACLERGLYPSWDAANLASVALAEKLGYRLDRPYCTYKLQEKKCVDHD